MVDSTGNFRRIACKNLLQSFHMTSEVSHKSIWVFHRDIWSISQWQKVSEVFLLSINYVWYAVDSMWCQLSVIFRHNCVLCWSMKSTYSSQPCSDHNTVRYVKLFERTWLCLYSSSFRPLVTYKQYIFWLPLTYTL